MTKNVLELLRVPAFWSFYQYNDADDLPGDLVERYAEKVPGGDGEVTFKPVVFVFSLPLSSRIEVEATLDWWTVHLYLADEDGGNRRILGWWDEERWHPFALHWDEAVALWHHWREHPDACGHEAAGAFLLIARFIGLGVDEKALFEDRCRQVAAAYREVGIVNPSRVDDLARRTLLQPTEKDYRWTRDDELGWVYGGKYPCYSLRNRAHLAGEEGLFPFADVGRLRSALVP